MQVRLPVSPPPAVAPKIDSTLCSAWHHAWLRRTLVIAMSDVTQILQQIEDGDPSAAEQLLPLVYDELRKLAAARMANESPDHTLQATALVHEAYVRLVDTSRPQRWDSRAHFFAAAAESMRRILVMSARRRRREKWGGERKRVEIDPALLASVERDDRLLALDEALSRLEEFQPDKARLVKLRFFGGLTMVEAAAALDISEATAARHWAYARAWLKREANSMTDSHISLGFRQIR